MRILLLGAYGFIGSEIGRRLLSEGHAVKAVGRDIRYGRRLLPAAEWRQADLSGMLTPGDWVLLLDDVDVVINASGLLQSGDGGSVANVQEQAIGALVEACLGCNVRQFVQLSAAGAQPDASTDFMRTKAAADRAVLDAPIKSVVLRPGLVIGRNSYGGTELIRSAAALPVALKLKFDGAIQCIALGDVVDAVMVALGLRSDQSEPVDLVEPDHRTLGEVIAAHRRWMALPPTRVQFSVPPPAIWMLGASANILGQLGWRPPLRTNALKALNAGSTGDPEQTARFLGRAPRTLTQALSDNPASKQDRLAARLYLALPLIVASLFLMWFLSGVATLAHPEEAQVILRDLRPTTARIIVMVGAIVDIALAIGLLWRPTAQRAALGMVVVTLAYLGGATALAPSFWLDPLAPLAKAAPAALLALIAAWLLDKR